MNLRNHLLREAGKLASSQTARRVRLFAEIATLEIRPNISEADAAELARMREDVENCGQALIRFGAYRPHQGASPHCPYCWIVTGDATILANGAQAETYHCENCRREYP